MPCFLPFKAQGPLRKTVENVSKSELIYEYTEIAFSEHIGTVVHTNTEKLWLSETQARQNSSMEIGMTFH